jgi:predicted Zn finger-like uncharacterized protein
MKISCESCSAQYDLDENRIPPSGMSMKCPACLHTFQVHRPAAARAAAPRPSAPDESDLPAPKSWSPPAPDGGADDLLPAPKSRVASAFIPPPPAPLPPKSPPLALVRSGGSDDAAAAELPAPVDRRGPDIIDLPAPKEGAQIPQLIDEAADLLAPKRDAERSGVGIDIDAPEIDDLGGPPPLEALEVERADSIDGDLPVPVDLDLPAPKEIDLLAPKEESPDLLTPKAESPDLLTPRPEPVELAPKRGLPVELPLAEPAPTAAAAPARAPQAPPLRARRWLPLGGAALLLGAVGVSLGLFTSTGYFGAHLFSGGRAQAEAQLLAARKLLADDTLASYRKASLGLRPLVEAEPHNLVAVAVEAQAHLGAARLGITAEGKSGEALVTRLDGDLKTVAEPEALKARALRALVAGRLSEARLPLSKVLARAPSDAAALVELGWVELQAGDPAAAQAAFARAVAAEPLRAAALFGQGLAKERLGEATAAEALYRRALARSPMHFGAAVGAARTGAVEARATGSAAAEAAVQELIQQRASTVGPKELADAWATLGILAAGAGRREEAEDRLKRALGLDADAAAARVALARVLCDRGRPAEGREALRKLVAAQPSNLEARLTLVRVLVESNGAAEAATTLAPLVESPPKDATLAGRVRDWQGRLALARERPDREQALAHFKTAVAAAPKLLDAYLDESSLLSQLGRADEALEVLKQAEAQAADDPQLTAELGEAYLAIHKAPEAESRFRAALDKSPARLATRMDLGVALEQQGKLDEAKAEYLAVEKAAPGFPGLAERRARLADKQGDKQGAWALFQTALAQGVPTQALRLAAGDLALELGHLDDAHGLGEAVLKEDDRSAGAHLLLARALLAAKKPEEALPEARRAATLSDLPEAHLALGHALEEVAKLDQAVSEYQVARRPPVEAEATLGRARIMVRMGATRDALAELNGLIRDNKLRPQALLLAGDAYTDLQMADKARHAYEDAVKYGPHIGEAAFKLGRALHDATRRKPAIEMLERALKLGGDHAPYAVEAFLLLGDAHREGRENAAAVHDYGRYLELAPPDAPGRAEVTREVALLGGK